MRAVKIILTVVVCILAVAGAGLGAYAFYQGRQLEQPETEEQAARPDAPADRARPTVGVTEVKTDTLEHLVFVSGTVKADKTVQVRPKTAGTLEVLRLQDGTPIREGIEVEKGDRIAVIEHEDLKAALNEAKANLRVAQASKREARVHLADAEREKNRILSLHEEGTVTDRERDQAMSAFDGAEARLELANERIGQAEATVSRARLRYEDAFVTAPISGVISEKYVDEGNRVDPASPLVKINNIEYVEVSGTVAGRHFPRLQPGETRASVAVDAYPDRPVTGVVDRVQPELDPTARTAHITVRIANPDGLLKPGMFARMHVAVIRRENVTVVPDTALIREDGQYRAFVVDDDMTARERSVEVGIGLADRYEVLEGLSPGEAVVVRGHHLLEDGMRVETREVSD